MSEIASVCVKGMVMVMVRRAFVLPESADERALCVPNASEPVVRAGHQIRAVRVPVERSNVLIAGHLGAAAIDAVLQDLLRHRHALSDRRVARAQTPDARRRVACAQCNATAVIFRLQVVNHY